MYGGSAYAYANDPDFTSVSTSEKYWQGVIDKFYEKYYGFAKWHTSIVQEAMQKGRLIMPTGRVYTFEMGRDWKGDLKAPETLIKNYPVQGLGADIMSIARVSFYKRFKKESLNGKLINSVHDSIVVDMDNQGVDDCARLFKETFRDIPRNFTGMFGKEWNLPLQCEIKVGKNMKEMIEYI